MAVTPISAQSTSTATLQAQEQQLLNQIQSLQSKNPQGNAAQIKVLQQKYKALLSQQQQHAQPTIPQQSPVEAKEPASQPETQAAQAPSTQPARLDGRGINIKA